MADPYTRPMLQALLRENFGAFVQKVFYTVSPGQAFIQSWSVAAIVNALERVRRGEVRRLIINLPPRSLKSLTASVAFPAYVLGKDPTRRIKSASATPRTSRTGCPTTRAQ